MDSGKIVAYATNKGTIFCPDCGEWIRETEEGQLFPVFSGEEFNYPPICDQCFATIESVIVIPTELEMTETIEADTKIRRSRKR